MRKRNDGETLWAYINEWLKQYWWLSLIIQTVITSIYCGIIYLAANTLIPEFWGTIISYVGLVVFVIFRRMSLHFNLLSKYDISFMSLYILFNIIQIIFVISSFCN